MINFLSDLNISANYIKKSIALAVLLKRAENSGASAPSRLTENKNIYFYIDNVELSADTPDWKKASSLNWYCSLSVKLSSTRGTFPTFSYS